VAAAATYGGHKPYLLDCPFDSSITTSGFPILSYGPTAKLKDRLVQREVEVVLSNFNLRRIPSADRLRPYWGKRPAHLSREQNPNLVVRNALQIGTNASITALLPNILRPESWNVQHASCNSSALELVGAQSYDLIVTSEKTPCREDIELLRKARRLSGQTRLIILADKNTTTDVITAMQEHAFSYFSQPFLLDELQRMVRIATEEADWDDGIDVVCATEQRIRLNVRCDFDTADRVCQYLEEIEALPNPERRQLITALRELLYNSIEYGGKLDPTTYVEVDHVRSPNRVMCRITDHGPGFTFDKIPHAAIVNPADDPVHHVDVRQKQGMRPGGYGILVARQAVDHLIYKQGGTEVLLVKYLASAKSQANV
jgi:DNA-binding response OmpR family regulator